MFDDIGGKIKVLAVVTCILGIIASVVGAIVVWKQSNYYYSTTGTGFLILIGGCLFSWIGSFFTYGFGELIEQNDLTNKYLSEIKSQLGTQPNKDETPVVSSPKPSYVYSPYKGETWICKKCGSHNKRDALYCKDCGEYR